ncbi:MAG: DUF433 domain-containing protein [Roseomonas sp.]|nr:DUF433 domain-containing protein [Roseomonas sp.]
MRPMPETLKPTEAATIASVALRDINRAIDEHILPAEFVSTADGRRVSLGACSLIAFYFSSADRLTAEERLLAIKEAGKRLRKFRGRSFASLLAEDWVLRREFLTIDFAPFLRRAHERLKRLEAARGMVVSDPEVLGGTPVLRGTRIPVHDLAASVAAGIPAARILAAYPGLDAQKLDLAILYAEANPARGRPRARRALPQNARIITDRKAPRRAQAG